MTAKKWIINDWGEEWLSKEWQAGDVIDALQQFAAVKVAEATKETYPKEFCLHILSVINEGYYKPENFDEVLKIWQDERDKII